VRRLILAAALCPLLAACAEAPVPAPAPTGVSYKLRDHQGTVADHATARTQPRPVIYTRTQVHPEGLSDPVTDRIAAEVLSLTPFGLSTTPETFPPTAPR
jgi:hypothetical protein